MFTNRAAATLSLMLFFSARCASIGHGRMERIAVDSQPRGAEVTILCAGSTVASGVTPVVLQMRRSATECAATLTRDGFQDEQVQLPRRHNRMFWMNALLASVVVPAAGVANSGGIGSEGLSPALYGVSAVGVAGLIYDHGSGRAYRHSPATTRPAHPGKWSSCRAFQSSIGCSARADAGAEMRLFATLCISVIGGRDADERADRIRAGAIPDGGSEGSS
jgi:hypothetical protein